MASLYTPKSLGKFAVPRNRESKRRYGLSEADKVASLAKRQTTLLNNGYKPRHVGESVDHMYSFEKMIEKAGSPGMMDLLNQVDGDKLNELFRENKWLVEMAYDYGGIVTDSDGFDWVEEGKVAELELVFEEYNRRYGGLNIPWQR